MPDSYDYADELVPIGKAAKILQVSIGTLQRWDREKILIARRLPSGQRRYRVGDLHKVLGASA